MMNHPERVAELVAGGAALLVLLGGFLARVLFGSH
jgi:hypothetical protein